MKLKNPPIGWEEANRLVRGWFDQNREYFSEVGIDKAVFDFFGFFQITLGARLEYMFRDDDLERYTRAGEELAALLGTEVAVRGYVGFFPPALRK